MPTPKFPRYSKNSLRPNPETADPAKGDMAFGQETIRIGHFGGDDASASRVNGLPSTEPPKPGGKGATRRVADLRQSRPIGRVEEA
jgi:hypothetical protein